MAKKNYVVIRTGTYGKLHEVVELDLGKDGLSDRQKIMLKPYEKPVAKADESKELTAAKAKIADLESAVKELTEANSALVKAKSNDK